MICLWSLAAAFQSDFTAALRDTNDKAVSVGVNKLGQAWFLPDSSLVSGNGLLNFRPDEINTTVLSREPQWTNTSAAAYIQTEELPPELKWRHQAFTPPLWDFNPFRMILSKGPHEGLRNDTECPHPDNFKRDLKYMSRGEVGVCVLRYAMIRHCDLPEEVCTSCWCREGECPLLTNCFSKLLPLWLHEFIGKPVLTLVIHLFLAPFLNYLYMYLMKFRWFESCVLHVIGSPERNALWPYFVMYLLSTQIIFSFLNTILFCILEVFEAPYPPWFSNGFYDEPAVGYFQFAVNIHMLLNYYAFWFKSGFQWSFLFSANALIDMFTVHGCLVRQLTYTFDKVPVGKDYRFDTDNTFLIFARPKMNLHFLRSYRCLTAWLAIVDVPIIARWPTFRKQVIKSGMTLFCFVLMFNGTAMLFEWLGHDLQLEYKNRQLLAECKAFAPGIPRFEHGRVDRQNIACAPFLIGFYWVFSVVSTLGAGDFTPHAVPTFLLVIVMLICGVAFMWQEGIKLQHAMVIVGRGQAEATTDGGHVVVTGGAVRDVDEFVLYQFIAQLLHPNVEEQGCRWPKVVLLGQIDNTKGIRRFLKYRLNPEPMKFIQFCNGDPLSAEGCTVAKVPMASMVYILPSSKSEDLQKEDEYNLHVALSVKNLTESQDVPFRIVMYGCHSMELALQSGIHPGQCVCLDSLRSSILAQASMVRGWPLLLTLLTTNASFNARGAKEYCKRGLFPEQYLASCANSLWGFAVNKRCAGKTFHELAHWMYQEVGALPLCAQINGNVVTFPWNEVITPDTIVYCIHNRNPEACPEGRMFCAAVDWRPHFVKEREAALEKSFAKDAAQQSGQKLQKNTALQDYVRLPTEILSPDVLSEEEMQIQRKKANAIKEGGKDFVLVVVTAVADFWRTLALYIDKVGIDGQEDIVLRSMPAIVLVPSSPPIDIANATGARDPKVQLAFVEGNWMEPDVLKSVGASKCKCVVTYPLHMLRAAPDNDTRTFFLLRLLNRMSMRSECNLVIELTSGMAGAHMIPVPPKMAEQGEILFEKVPAHLQEDAFSPSCAAGQVIVPRSLLGLVAKSYYVFGIVEAVHHMTLADREHVTLADATLGVRPEQIHIPEAMAGKPYHEIVEAFLLNRYEENTLAPSPAIVLGLLRETMYMEAVLLHPPRDTRTERSDLLIVLATGAWAKWADDKGLRCIGGRSKRKSDM
mmetsp:Transcript_100280/g.173047  ORF Transcript_100280/g.173047 Transcript_100280/m.173047 type:complete len:1198 (-) Transcript_100280:171-3764(-)